MRLLLVATVASIGSLAAGATFAQQNETNVRLGPKDARPAMRWLLSLRVNNANADYVVNEYEEGDVPLPAGSKWKCKFEAVSAYRDRLLLPVEGEPTLYRKTERIVVYRGLRCSSDNWETWSSHGGAYSIRDGAFGESPSQAEQHVSTKDGFNASMSLRPCAPNTKDPFCQGAPKTLRGTAVTR